MNKLFLKTGAFFGLTGVMLGAFGAHAFQEHLESLGNFATYQTAVNYLFYHAFATILTGILSKENKSKWMRIAGFAFLFGTIIFSGSLFMICLTGTKTYGIIAPIGGTALILGWGSLFVSFFKKD